MSGYRRLVLTFDAFGTLFIPKEPIAKSYADVARKYGLLSDISNDQVGLSFRDALKQQRTNAPNYGKEVGMNSSQWWSNVIHSTFSPFVPSTTLPEQLVPELLNRYNSSEGYDVYPDVRPFFRILQKMREDAQRDSTLPKITVGVVTNSDDRVLSILSSLGLTVGPQRHRMLAKNPEQHPEGAADIDFVVLSYDVGFEKPAREIFDAARDLTLSFDSPGDRFIHVGDTVTVDYQGAEGAGWDGILLVRDNSFNIRELAKMAKVPYIYGLEKLGVHVLPQSAESWWKYRQILRDQRS